MNLFPHNQQAYDAAKHAFCKSDRTCIIHPTGTGKSLIIAKFIEQHARKKHLLLAPGHHIMEEVMKHTEAPFVFSSYANFVYNDVDKDLALSGFDYIYLDEFHRIGAEIWGREVQRLFALNATAKILGTSATHIRYLDDHRNMADEIFNGNVASNMSLNMAIAVGILPAPTYVAALYSVKEEYENLLKKIEESNHRNKTLLAQKIKHSVIDWERSKGIDAIIQKYLKPTRKKIIVFCRNHKHITLAEKLLQPSLQKVHPDIESTHIYSDYSYKKNKDTLASFSTQDKKPRVLFTIDMVNEGLHVNGVDTIILLRETISPIIFYQQIGRAFSAGQKMAPLIFDLVNNFDSLRVKDFEKEFRDEASLLKMTELGQAVGMASKITSQKISVQFIDETKEIADLMKAFSNSIENWQVMYEEATEYYKQHGHLDPPGINYQLFNWLKGQRSMQASGALNKIKKELLEAIGINWAPHKTLWQKNVEALTTWKHKHKELPQREENPSLYVWIANVKKNFKNNKLTQQKIDSLKGLLDLNDTMEAQWLASYEIAKKLFAETGFINPGKDDAALGQWTVNNRMLYRRGRMPAEHKQLLDAIGFVFNANDFAWQQNYNKVIACIKQNGQLPKGVKNGYLLEFIRLQKKRADSGNLPNDKLKKMQPIFKLL